MDHGDSQAAGSRPLDLRRRMLDVQPAAAMSWYVQLMAGSGSETLTTGNIRRKSAAVHHSSELQDYHKWKPAVVMHPRRRKSTFQAPLLKNLTTNL